MDLINRIMDGSHDDELDSIVQAVRDRKASLARVGIASINPGATITLSRTIRPAYLRGLKATVKKVNGASVVIDIDANPAYGRFSGARNVRVPAVCIER